MTCSLYYCISTSICNPILSCLLLWTLTQSWSGSKVLNLNHLLLLALIRIIFVVLRHCFVRAQIFWILLHWSYGASSSLICVDVLAWVSRTSRSNFLYIFWSISSIGSSCTSDTSSTINVCSSQWSFVITVSLCVIQLCWVLLNGLLLFCQLSTVCVTCWSRW